MMDLPHSAPGGSSYGPPAAAAAASAVQAAIDLASDTQPHVRQQALTLLTALAQQHGASDSISTSQVDAIFQRLCVIAATDTTAKLRLQALQSLAGFHHASTVIKLQALSKKATLRGAAAQQHQQAAPPPAKKQRQLAQPDRPSTADAGLLDAATGAFVHGSEDDLPRVRLAAVAAVVSLSSQDALFADVAGSLLSDLIGDQLLEVRLAALQALLAQATGFQQRKQVQQQQEQEPVAQPADAPSDAETPYSDIAGAASDSQAGLRDAATNMDVDADPDAAAASEPAFTQQGDQQQAHMRRRKPHKSDLPSWGKDALIAAAAALSDREPAVRALALQLLMLLPPGNVPDLVAVISGVAACCARYPSQDGEQVWALVAWLGSVRAEMVTLAVGKLAPQLASMLPATADGQDAAAAAGASTAVEAGEVSTGTGIDAGDAGSAVLPAARVLGSAAAQDISRLPPGAQILAAVMLLGVRQRSAGLAALLKQLQKAQLLEHPALQPWLGHVRALEPQQQQQQQEEDEEEDGEV